MAVFWIGPLFYSIILALVLGVGIGTGFLLSWMISGITVGEAIIAGIFASGISLHIFIALIALIQSGFRENGEVQEDDPSFYILPDFSARSRRPKRRRKNVP